MTKKLSLILINYPITILDLVMSIESLIKYNKNKYKTWIDMRTEGVEYLNRTNNRITTVMTV